MTNNEPQQAQYPQNYPPYEDEINLIDYLRVIWKWKVSIVLINVINLRETVKFILII